jgi:hypothetical protein
MKVLSRKLLDQSMVVRTIRRLSIGQKKQYITLSDHYDWIVSVTVVVQAALFPKQ